LRLLIETDAGGDPDDEQSLVRFLLYANEWEVEGIIANRPQARPGENRNSERTGLGIVRRLLEAYGQCHSNLVQHDPRYPPKDHLWARTMPGYLDTEAAVDLILQTVDRSDPRPLWYSDWGTDRGAATNNLRRALDRVWRERGPDGYAAFKRKLRLASYDQFGPHTAVLAPPFPLWVNTFQPELENRRWYHRFSALTATAGGFDLMRDVLENHGPLGALYPTNTTHWQKEGDTMTFLYLIPTGMNDPEQPTWGSWAGRYGLNERWPGKAYYWANQADTWRGSTHRDNTLARWAAALQADFRARLDWCVKPYAAANHRPQAVLAAQSKPHAEGAPPGAARRSRPAKPSAGNIVFLEAAAGDEVTLSAADSVDPDGHKLSFEWFPYPEAGTYQGEITLGAATEPQTRFLVPAEAATKTIHLLVAVTDDGSPPLTSYCRAVISVH
jgi:hypothetical protein